MNRSELLDTYIETIIDGMDHKDLWQYVYDSLEQNFETYSEEELREEVKEYYPHILED
jgi:septin family protein